MGVSTLLSESGPLFCQKVAALQNAVSQITIVPPTAQGVCEKEAPKFIYLTSGHPPRVARKVVPVL